MLMKLLPFANVLQLYMSFLNIPTHLHEILHNLNASLYSRNHACQKFSLEIQSNFKNKLKTDFVNTWTALVLSVENLFNACMFFRYPLPKSAMVYTFDWGTTESIFIP